VLRQVGANTGSRLLKPIRVRRYLPIRLDPADRNRLKLDPATPRSFRHCDENLITAAIHPCPCFFVFISASPASRSIKRDDTRVRIARGIYHRIKVRLLNFRSCNCESPRTTRQLNQTSFACCSYSHICKFVLTRIRILEEQRLRTAFTLSFLRISH